MSQTTPRRKPFRQVLSEAFNPVIPTEVFIELNPQLVQFYENEYAPANVPAYYGNLYQSWNCSPRRLCVPRPCTPI